jgi:ABC-type transporter Mla maintaining outer membrane lipid asymmetry ATPase subunit MlaF
MSDIIELKKVTVTVVDYTVLSGLSVAFPEGEITCIVGKSGSGKSTLLKTSAGLVIPQWGQVFFRGKNLARMNSLEELTFRKKAAFGFQDAALWENQSIYNNLSLPVALHNPGISKTESDRRVKMAVQTVGYNEGLAFRPADLSTGEQKLISLARSLILEPELLFLDEPTASLDEDSVDRLIDILKNIKKEGRSMIIVSHDGRLIAELADRLCVVAQGSIAGFGTVEQVAPLLGGDLIRRIRQARSRSDGIDDSKGGT